MQEKALAEFVEGQEKVEPLQLGIFFFIFKLHYLWASGFSQGHRRTFILVLWSKLLLRVLPAKGTLFPNPLNPLLSCLSLASELILSKSGWNSWPCEPSLNLSVSIGKVCADASQYPSANLSLESWPLQLCQVEVLSTGTLCHSHHPFPSCHFASWKSLVLWEDSSVILTNIHGTLIKQSVDVIKLCKLVIFSFHREISQTRVWTKVRDHLGGIWTKVKGIMSRV